MASGREVGGYPKKIANIGMEQFGNEWSGYLERRDKRLLSISNAAAASCSRLRCLRTGRWYCRSLSNMTFPLPAPTGEPQEFIPLPLSSLREIPGFGKKNPDPALAQVLLTNWQLYGTFYQGDATSLAVGRRQRPYL